jgi:hypothetical protein
MGYYIISSGRMHGILGEKGYYLVNPNSWDSLLTEARKNADYSALDSLVSRRFNLSTVSLQTARTTWLLTCRYPSGHLDYTTAKLKFSAELVHEKSIYDSLLSALTQRDVNFSLEKEDLCHDRSESIRSLLSVFLARSDYVMEIGSGILRICQKPSAFLRLLSTQTTGGTVAMLDINDVLRIEVEPNVLGISLSRRRWLSLGRTDCRLTDSR